MGVIIPPFSSTEDRGYKFLCTFQILSLERSDRRLVWVEGGIPPYNWEVSGTTFTLDSATTNVQYNYVNSIAEAAVDTKEIITVTDDEGSFVTCNVHITTWDEEKCCGGIDECEGATSVVIDAINTNDEVQKSKLYPITASGGVGPYTWSISEGFGSTLDYEVTETGDNILIVTSGFCGVNYSAQGEVTVSDACGSTDSRSFIITSGTYYCMKGYQNVAATYSCDNFIGWADHCIGYSYISWASKGMYHYMYQATLTPYPGGWSWYPCNDWADNSTSWDPRYCISDGRGVHCNTLPPCGSPEDCMRIAGALISCGTCGDESLARCIFGYSEVRVRSCIGDPECY